MNVPTPAALAKIDLLTVDVFDTLLLRRPTCERRRLRRVALAAVKDPRLAPFGLDAGTLLWARRQAARFGYRVTALDDPTRDIRLRDLLARVARLLELPLEAVDILARLELHEEMRAVTPNARLVTWLRAVRAGGTRVVLLSDTYYSEQQLRALLAATGVDDICDAVYTSAELGYTKRGGNAFRAVAACEQVPLSGIAHLGDDRLADGEAPRRHGIQAFVTPRPASLRILRALDAARFLATEQRPHLSLPGTGRTAAHGVVRHRLGQLVLGPVVAEYCLQLWLYLSSIARPEEALALFCARGGLRMRRAFERALERLGLPLPVRTGDLMVSRLVAARGAVLRRSVYACEELAREFKGASAARVARALAPRPLEFGEAWDIPFDATGFLALLEQDPAGRQLKCELHEQNVLFERHVDQLSGGAQRLVLCDTGLFASTQRLLEEASPGRNWESVLFARCNYKGFDTPHFARTTGLIVERDAYTPFDRRSSILRYWHLIEALFEPRLESVRSFAARADGRVHANLEQHGWERNLEGEPGSLFAGVLDYLDGLRPGDARRIVTDSEKGWSYLSHAIRFPTPAQVSLLMVEERSRDLGTGETVPVVADHGARLKLGRVRQALWREAYLAQAVPGFRRVLHSLWEALYIARSLRKHVKVL